MRKQKKPSVPKEALKKSKTSDSLTLTKKTAKRPDSRVTDRAIRPDSVKKNPAEQPDSITICSADRPNSGANGREDS